jgi:hypothetical protein
VASGPWTYTQVRKDVASNVGDCTDFVENAMRDAGLPSLGTASNLGAVRVAAWPEDPVGNFAGSAASASGDFIPVSGTVRRGDIVVFGGHAGIASGTVNANGTIQAIQNGQSGTGNWNAPAAATIYRRLVPSQHQ